MGLSAFFSKLKSYGGISINEGIIRIWKDPNVFYEKKVYTTFYFECYKCLGKDFEELLYVTGKLAGHYNSVTLGEFFGIKTQRIWINDHADADEFMNGATQDGWGFAKITKYPEKEKKIYIEFEIKDEKIPYEIIKKYKIKKQIIYHSYVTGIIAAGASYLLRKEIEAFEEVCSSNDSNLKNCKLIGKETEKEIESKLLKKAGLDIKELYKKALPMFVTRHFDFKPFTILTISFGDGNFKIKNYDGSVMLIISHIIIMKTLKNVLKEDKYANILEETAKVHSEVLKKELPNVKDYGLSALNNILDELSLFGYGKFQANMSGEKNHIITITNMNNPVAQDYYTLFGQQKETTDDYLCFLFTNIIKTFFNLDSECEEIQCISKGNNACLFQINITI